jgi:hypothetical protein
LVDQIKSLRADIQVLRGDLGVYKKQSDTNDDKMKLDLQVSLGCLFLAFMCFFMVVNRVLHHRDVILGQKRFNDQVSAVTAVVEGFKGDVQDGRNSFDVQIAEVNKSIEGMRGVISAMPVPSSSTIIIPPGPERKLSFLGKIKKFFGGKKDGE